MCKPTILCRAGLLLGAALVAGRSDAVELFSEDYSSGLTTITSLTPSTVINGGSATPVFEIEPFIVSPTMNGGVGPNLLTFDPSTIIPPSVPEGFQSINFDGPAHPNDPGTYNEIIATGAWWSDNPTTFFHQNASIDIDPTLATRDKVYVLEYSVASNITTSGTENFGARIGLFDSKDQGVYMSHNYNNRSAGDRFKRVNQINVHRVNADGINVHIENGDSTFTTERGNWAWGDSLTPDAPALDFTDFRFRSEDTTGILSHFFENEVVLRMSPLDRGQMNLEWFIPDSAPAIPGDLDSTPFGGDPGDRPEQDGWHNLTVLENIYDLSGGGATPLGDIAKLRISLWNPSWNSGNGVTVSNLDEIDTTDGQNRTTNNFQIGFGRIAVKEYHVGDIDRDGLVTAADVTGTPLLSQLNIRDERVWADGDTDGDNDVTVADALAGVLTEVAGVAPTGPSLVYNSTTGGLSINAGGASVSGFALVAEDGSSFFTNQFNNPASGSAISTEDASELAWMNLTTAGSAAGGNLTGTINLGAVMPTGLSAQEFEDFFAAAVFNVGDALSRANSFFAEPGLPGDFNGDGTVDAADYTVWRDGLGTTFVAGDYDIWVANYGATAAPSVSIPEPGTGLFAVLLLLSAVAKHSPRS